MRELTPWRQRALERLVDVRRFPSLVAYALAAALVALAVGLRAVLDAMVPGTAPFATLFPAVLLAALIGGAGPGLLALLLGGASAFLWLMPAAPAATIAANLALYAITGGLVAMLAYGLHRALVRAAEQRIRLELAEDAGGIGPLEGDPRNNPPWGAPQPRRKPGVDRG